MGEEKKEVLERERRKKRRRGEKGRGRESTINYGFMKLEGATVGEEEEEVLERREKREERRSFREGEEGEEGRNVRGWERKNMGSILLFGNLFF